MSNLLTFGMHEDRSMERLFFYAPWYAEWMDGAAIHRDRHKFSEQAGDYFRELMRRAWHLQGTCRYCGKRPFTRMGLSTHRSGALGHVDFFCDECEYTGGSATGYHRPSFFVDTHTLPRCEQKRIVEVIKHRYIGDGSLTQAKMERFFRTDEFFVHATPWFFNRFPLATLSG